MSDIQHRMEQALGRMQSEVEEFSKLGNSSVEVGLPMDRIHIPSGKPLAEIGAIHEFGLGDIPERSFLRSLTILKRSEIISAMKVQAEKAAGGDDANLIMEQFALFAQGLAQENVIELDTPPLASPRPDGSDNPLNDTGAMRQGIIGVVVYD